MTYQNCNQTIGVDLSNEPRTKVVHSTAGAAKARPADLRGTHSHSLSHTHIAYAHYDDIIRSPMIDRRARKNTNNNFCRSH